jgi:pilus assembly protein Flp/PilA
MLRQTLRALVADESGAAAIEYGLIAGLVSVAAIAAMSSLGDSLQELFDSVASALEDAFG